MPEYTAADVREAAEQIAEAYGILGSVLATRASEMLLQYARALDRAARVDGQSPPAHAVDGGTAE